jgi:hypothetical protein
MRVGGVLALFLFLASVDAQHLFLAGGGLTAESYFFWNRLILFAASFASRHLSVIIFKLTFSRFVVYLRAVGAKPKSAS